MVGLVGEERCKRRMVAVRLLGSRFGQRAGFGKVEFQKEKCRICNGDDVNIVRRGVSLRLRGDGRWRL
jgi:hypothetical protein